MKWLTEMKEKARYLLQGKKGLLNFTKGFPESLVRERRGRLSGQPDHQICHPSITLCCHT